MYVNPESAYTAIELLNVMAKTLGDKNTLSQLDSKLYDTIEEIKALLAHKPFKEYKDIKEAVANYVEYRDQLSIERKAWEEHERDIKDEMTRISMWLRDRGDEMGVDSFNTPYGTAYRNVKKSFRIEDWQEYSSWIIKTNNAQCLEKRPAKLAVQDIIDETGEIPPGLMEFVEVEFNVRRPTKSKA